MSEEVPKSNAENVGQGLQALGCMIMSGVAFIILAVVLVSFLWAVLFG